ncbi:MAG TPA: adenine methyltransferase [Porphyromonadaceae bacterium]|nr:adenine methyltransferase [Porphyromonadaceae bacterium]
MNVSYEIVAEHTSIEWYTPPEIIKSLGKFDLDPCTSDIAWKFNRSAKKYYTIQEDGLSKEWFGRVWLNPPYSQPSVGLFMEKMAIHNNGIALLYNRTDNKMFQEIILPVSDSIMFLSGRIHFFRPDGTKGSQPGAGSILIAFGQHNTIALENSGLKGHVFKSTKRNIALQDNLIFE